MTWCINFIGFQNRWVESCLTVFRQVNHAKSRVTVKFPGFAVIYKKDSFVSSQEDLFGSKEYKFCKWFKSINQHNPKLVQGIWKYLEILVSFINCLLRVARNRTYLMSNICKRIFALTNLPPVSFYLSKFKQEITVS